MSIVNGGLPMRQVRKQGYLLAVAGAQRKKEFVGGAALKASELGDISYFFVFVLAAGQRG